LKEGRGRGLGEKGKQKRRRGTTGRNVVSSGEEILSGTESEAILKSGRGARRSGVAAL